MSTINWDDLNSNTLADLKREAKSRNLETPRKATKKELIQILSSQKKQTYMSDKFLIPSDYSQHESQNASPRGSPSPKSVYQTPKAKNTATSSLKQKETFVQNGILSAGNEFQQGQPEKQREHSPLLPPSSSKHKKQTDSHKKSSHNTGERKVRYNNVDFSQQKSNSSFNQDYSDPKKFLILNYLSGFITIVFSVLGIWNPWLFIFAFINGIIFYYFHVKLNSILEKKAYSLASKVTAYLEKEPNGSALKSQLKKKFNVDRYVMRKLATFLTSKKRIETTNKDNGDQIWTLRN